MSLITSHEEQAVLRRQRSRALSQAYRVAESPSARSRRLERERIYNQTRRARAQMLSSAQRVRSRSHSPDDALSDRVEIRDNDTTQSLQSQSVHPTQDINHNSTYRPNTRTLFRVAIDYQNKFNPALILFFSTLIEQMIGKLGDVECAYCHALRFKSETKNFCCESGKVKLEEYPHPPDKFANLIDGVGPLSAKFLKSFRIYNSIFTMTSFGANIENRDCPWGSFKISGQISHRLGSLLPQPGVQPQFLQLYFIGDRIEESRARQSIGNSTDLDIIKMWQDLLHSSNRLIREFKSAKDSALGDSHQITIRSEIVPRDDHAGRWTAPTISEDAVIVVGNTGNPRDIIVQRKTGSLQRIFPTFPFYDALQYPLILWRGCTGWYDGIRHINPLNGNAAIRRVTQLEFYKWHMQIRRPLSYLHKTRRLFAQWTTDMASKLMSSRLMFQRLNQKRIAPWALLEDAVQNDINVGRVGRTVLSSSVVGSPRHMHQYAQDTLCMVKNFGIPSLFITVTCSVEWPAIKDNLLLGQSAYDRVDLIARGFNQYLKAFKSLMRDKGIMGKIKAFVNSIEWQKRGLPHTHMLYWLEEPLRIDQVDDYICAEIPDPNIHPELHKLVCKYMLHGPCDRRCLKNGKCSKGFPKPFCRTTHIRRGKTVYRRRSPEDGGHVFVKDPNTPKQFTFTNAHVVPYNPALLLIMQCHVNVEHCHSAQACKYISKYIFKGPDMAAVTLQDITQTSGVDEILQFAEGRYLSATEAAHQLFEFPIHDRSHAVHRLDVHLPNGQRTVFTEQTATDQIASPPETILTAFFRLNANDPSARQYLYEEVPQHYAFDLKTKTFTRRKNSWSVCSRLYGVLFQNHECWHLRLLLNHVRGARSFKELREFDGIEHPTFHAACLARGLLTDDKQFREAMREGCLYLSAESLRTLFIIIVCQAEISDQMRLWLEFRNNLSEDFITRYPDICIDRIYNHVLILLDESIHLQFSKHTYDFQLPAANYQDRISGRDYLLELNYDKEELQSMIDTKLTSLNTDQRAVFDKIIACVDHGVGGIFFLDAPGGTGKTFLLELILARVRLDGKIALAMAQTGIAAQLLTGGRTAHSSLKLPFDTSDCIGSTISPHEMKGRLLKECSLIVWDECTMATKVHLDILQANLQDCRENSELFGGVLVLLSGDFRQILPVVPRGSGFEELNVCLKSSPLWCHVEELHLHENMRIKNSACANPQRHASNLLKIGEGKAPYSLNLSLNEHFCSMVDSADRLLQRVFPSIESRYKDIDWLSERCILTTTNDAVDALNTKLLQMMTLDTHSYYSIDTCLDESRAHEFQPELLNSFNPSGFPPHKLTLVAGAPIILLRNLQPPMLCNGTRLIVVNMSRNLITARIVSGKFRGQIVAIPLLEREGDLRQGSLCTNCLAKLA